VEHNDSLPIPQLHQQLTLHEDEPTNTSPEDEPISLCSIVDPDFPKRTVPNLIPQSDLVRDLNISKNQAELVYRDGVCYSKVLKCHTGNPSNDCHHLFLRTAYYSVVMV
jgi:hypothetical protein